MFHILLSILIKINLNLTLLTWKEAIRSYIIPFLLLGANAFLYLKEDTFKFKIIWIIGSVVPSSIVLLFFKFMETSAYDESLPQGLIAIDTSDYILQVFVLFPRVYITIQLILLYTWKVERGKFIN